MSMELSKQFLGVGVGKSYKQNFVIEYLPCHPIIPPTIEIKWSSYSHSRGCEVT